MIQRVILTGGPGAGKTAILNALAEDGIRTEVDVAREIIRERLAAGLSPRPPPEEFSQESFERNLAAYEQAARHDLTIFERGVCESVASLCIRGFISRAEADRQMSRYRYDEPVFVAPPWREIYTTDTERPDLRTFGKSVRGNRRLVPAIRLSDQRDSNWLSCRPC